MKLTQLFSILFIISSICVASIKPENSKQIESIQITNQSNTKFTYYHLKNKGEIIFENLDRILKKDKNYIIKIMARSPISKNSNSNKTFGFELNIKNKEKTITSDNLKYKKKVSKVINPDINGMYYTDAGYWVEEIFEPKNLKIKIKSLKNSPDVYIKVTYKEIVIPESKESLSPVSQKLYNTFYIDYDDNPTKKSIKWYSIDDNKVQYKITGPKQIKIRTRVPLNSTKQNYEFTIYENGYKKSNHLYKLKNPRNEVYILDDDNNKIQLSQEGNFIINVPKGTHYYSFIKKYEELELMYIKIESLY